MFNRALVLEELMLPEQAREAWQKYLDLDPKSAGFAAVISGHSHKPSADMRHGVLYLNPGSAGPRRFKLPICLARLHVTGSELRHELVELQIDERSA